MHDDAKQKDMYRSCTYLGTYVDSLSPLAMAIPFPFPRTLPQANHEHLNRRSVG